MANVGLVAVLSLGSNFVVPSHLRFAAGVCVLAAGLLMGSAAVAVADPDSSNSAAPSQGSITASSQASITASSPASTYGKQPGRQRC